MNNIKKWARYIVPYVIFGGALLYASDVSLFLEDHYWHYGHFWRRVGLVCFVLAVAIAIYDCVKSHENISALRGVEESCKFYERRCVELMEENEELQRQLRG